MNTSNSNRLSKEQITELIRYYHSEFDTILSFDKTKTLTFSDTTDNREKKVRCDAIAWEKSGAFDDFIRIYLIITDNRKNLLAREFDVSVLLQKELDFFNKAIQELLLEDSAVLFCVNPTKEIYKGKYWDIINRRFLSEIEVLS